MNYTCASAGDVKDPGYLEGVGGHLIGTLHMVRGLPIILRIHVFVNVLPLLFLHGWRSWFDLGTE